MTVSIQKTRFSMIKKRHALTALKAIKEGKADFILKELLEFIIGTKNFFTSSSCSGRIILLGIPKNGSKKEAFFHRKWHRIVLFEEVFNALKEKTSGEIWFKMESFILHLGTNSLKNCKKILKAMRKAGIKRGGIMVAKEGKFIVEAIGTESIALPVKSENKILIKKEFLKKIVKEANKKMVKNIERLKKFENELKKELSD
jgi:tRNA wybutosine-synthesizing protein 3